MAGLLAVGGAGVAFGLLLVLVRWNWAPLSRLDRGSSEDLNKLVAPHKAVVAVLQAFTSLGGRTVLIWLIAMVAIGLLIRRRPRLAVYLLVTGTGALLLDPALKAIVGRLRPAVDAPLTAFAGDSFPSGHSLGSFVMYGALLLVFLPAMSGRSRRIAVAVVGLLVFAIGFSRVALGAHFPSDVLGAWLLGAAWLGVTAYAFRLWRREEGRRPVPMTEGLDPEAARDIKPATPAETVLPRPWIQTAEILTGWVLIFGAIYGLGVLVTGYLGKGFLARFDEAVPDWFQAHRTPGLDGISWALSKAGDTHGILAVSLIFCPLALAVLRRWRPVLFLALVMFGELSLFLAIAAAVDRPRPTVSQMDGLLATSSYPSGHIAATACLYTAMAVIVMPRTRQWWRWLFVALAVVMPLLVAVSRIYRGMHHPTDAVGGLLLAGLVVLLMHRVVRPNADLDRAEAS